MNTAKEVFWMLTTIGYVMLGFILCALFGYGWAGLHGERVSDSHEALMIGVKAILVLCMVFALAHAGVWLTRQIVGWLRRS